MIPLIETSRPQACIGAAAVSVLGSHLSGGPPGEAVAVAALAAFLIVAACNIVNDIVDLPVDRFNRPERPLPSGRVRVRTALVAAAVVALAGLATTLRLGAPATIAAAGFLVAGIAYSLLVRRVGLLGHLWVGVMFGATAIWGGWTSAGTPRPVWAAGVLVTLFLVPRELLKSLGDVRGDTVAGWRTAAVVWGTEATMWATTAAVVVFAAATLMPPLGGIGGVPYLVWMWVGAVVPLAAIMVWLWPDIDHRLRRSEFLTGLMWFPGLAALWQLG